MRHLARTRATRSTLGIWTSLLVLMYALVPGLHVHTCESGSHGAVDAAAVLDALPAHGHDTPATDDTVAHDCEVCRLLTHSGAVSPDAAIPAFQIAESSSPLLGDVARLSDETWFDDRGRGPPARTR